MLESEKFNYIDAVVIKVKEEKYLLEVKDVKEIFIPKDLIVPVPLTDKIIVGVIDIRGTLYTIISLKQKIYPSDGAYNIDDNTRILLLEYEELNIAIMVDSVIGVRKLPIEIFETKSTIVETHIDYNFIKSLGVLNEETYILLDLETLINPDELYELKRSQPMVAYRPRTTKATTSAREEYTEFNAPELPRLPELKSSRLQTVPVKVKAHPYESGKKVNLSKDQEDLLKEIGNIGSGNAITALSRLIKKKVDVDLTNVGIVSFEQIPSQFGGKEVEVCGIFSRLQKPSASTILQAFELRPLMEIVANLAGKDSKIDPTKVKSRKDLDKFAVSTIQEIGNIMAGHYASALADLIGTKIMIDLPEFEVSNAGVLGDFIKQELKDLSNFVVAISTTIKIVDLKLKGVFFFIPDVNTLNSIFDKLGIEHEDLNLASMAMKRPVNLDSIELTELQRDALQEVGNMGAGNAANALAKMINKRVDIDIPAVEMVKLDDYSKTLTKRNEKIFIAWSNVLGKTRATLLSIFKINDIIKIASIIIDEEKKLDAKKINSIQNIDEFYRSALNEICHILASHYASALGDLLEIRMMTEPPDMSIDKGQQLFKILKEEIGLLKKLSLVITTNVIIADIKITGTFLYIPDIDTLQELLDALAKFYE